MTSFTDPMQELNQKVLEKQAHGLLAEIEGNLVAGNLPAAFDRLYFYISQEAARSIIEMFPEIAVIFSARDALLAFANRDKAMACWQAFVEAEHLIATGSFDEATSLLRRARAGFAGTPEFTRLCDIWLSVKAEQLRMALMRGDEQAARKLEKEIDNREIACKIQVEIDQLFSITCIEIEVEHADNNIKFNLGKNKGVKVSLLATFDNKAFFTLRHDEHEPKSCSLVEYDANTNRAFEYDIAATANNLIGDIKPVLGLEGEYYIQWESTQLARVVLEQFGSKTIVMFDTNTLDVFKDGKNASHHIQSYACFDNNSLLVHFCDDDAIEQRVTLLEVKNGTILKEESVDYEWTYSCNSLINNKKISVMFLEGFSEHIHVYDRYLNHDTIVIDAKYDYYQNIEIDYDKNCIYIIGACRRGEDERDIFDILVLDFDYKIINRYENIFPYQPESFWLNYDFKYDIANGLIYFSEITSYCAYDFINRYFICSTSIPIQLITDKKNNYRLEHEPKTDRFFLKNMQDILQRRNELLQDKDKQNLFHKLLETLNFSFYERYIDQIRQAHQQNNLEKCLEDAIQTHKVFFNGNNSWDSKEMAFFTNGLQAIADAVRQGYDRDL